MTNGALIILTGGKAVGKTTVAQELIKLDPTFKRLVTYTSRPPRDHEIEGRDYHFLSEKEFEQKINSGFFFEYVKYTGHYKGTSKQSLNEAAGGQRIIWIIDPSRAVTIKGELPAEIANKTRVFLITTPDYEDQILRFKADRNRELNPEELAAFKKSLDVDLPFLSQRNKFDAVIINKADQVSSAAQEILEFIQKSK